MAISRFYRTCLIGLFSFLALPAIAQPVDTTAILAKADSFRIAADGIFQQGDLLTARETYQEAAQLLKTTIGENNTSYASCLNGLGACCMTLGEYEKAIGYHEQALAIRKEFLGEKHPFYATSLNNLGSCYLLMREAKKVSACQTGLGEVSGEGVFGLQRGFKKAGVNAILMSLWGVDDEATSLLMTSFYRELAKGLSKNEALRAAQKDVRDYKARDFSSPWYWAAFIMLDGD